MDDLFFAELRRRIRHMGTLKHADLSQLYKVLKQELKPLGYWRNRPKRPNTDGPS